MDEIGIGVGIFWDTGKRSFLLIFLFFSDSSDFSISFLQGVSFSLSIAWNGLCIRQFCIYFTGTLPLDLFPHRGF